MSAKQRRSKTCDLLCRHTAYHLPVGSITAFFLFPAKKTFPFPFKSDIMWALSKFIKISSLDKSTRFPCCPYKRSGSIYPSISSKNIQQPDVGIAHDAEAAATKEIQTGAQQVIGTLSPCLLVPQPRERNVSQYGTRINLSHTGNPGNIRWISYQNRLS